jgi:hypothetical protein
VDYCQHSIIFHFNLSSDPRFIHPGWLIRHPVAIKNSQVVRSEYGNSKPPPNFARNGWCKASRYGCLFLGRCGKSIVFGKWSAASRFHGGRPTFMLIPERYQTSIKLLSKRPCLPCNPCESPMIRIAPPPICVAGQLPPCDACLPETADATNIPEYLAQMD